MFIQNGLFSSESVSEGHPDKLADRISDRILDRFLSMEPNSRVACETFIADQYVIVSGEFKTKSKDVFDLVKNEAQMIVRNTIRETGYNDAAASINPDYCRVEILFNHQSIDISAGVDRRDGTLGAGDQGMMFGYACTETDVFMPAPIIYAHRLVQRLAELRKSGTLNWLRPDAKSQVTFRYENGVPEEITAVVMSTQHSESVETDTVRQNLGKMIIDSLIPKEIRAKDIKIYINPAGRFVIGGPKGDTGLTGRKIIVDTYGGSAPHGGGAFSGKDPSKVDRSGAYMARFLAKQAVSRGWADKAVVQIAYAIGIAHPVSFIVETGDKSILSGSEITAKLLKEFDLRPEAIIEFLDLKRPIYYPTAAYGHFGRADISLSWEEIINAKKEVAAR